MKCNNKCRIVFLLIALPSMLHGMAAVVTEQLATNLAMHAVQRAQQTEAVVIETQLDAVLHPGFASAALHNGQVLHETVHDQPSVVVDHHMVNRSEYAPSYAVYEARAQCMQRTVIPNLSGRELQIVSDQQVGVQDVLMGRNNNPQLSISYRSLDKDPFEKGYLKIELINAVRSSQAVKSIIKKINELFLEFCDAFQAAQTGQEYRSALDILDCIRSELHRIKKFGPISYLLVPSIAKVIDHIQLPLLEQQLGVKDFLSQNDIEQITWAVQCHFDQMHNYTHQPAFRLPEGMLKDVVVQHKTSSFFGRLIDNISYYASYAIRDVKDVAALRTAYQKMLEQEQVAQLTVDTDYQQLLNDIEAQKSSNHTLNEYFQKRKDALSKMINGDHHVYKKYYSVSRRAKRSLKQAGIDVNEFATCKGNHVQQDTHAKLVNAVNKLVETKPQTAHGKTIKEGALELAQAGNLLNQVGNIREAILTSDILHTVAECSWILFDKLMGFQSVPEGLRQFQIAATKGSLRGITDVSGICSGVCNSIKSLAQGFYDWGMFVAEQETLVEAVEQGRFADAQEMALKNKERAERLRIFVGHMNNKVSSFFGQIDSMTLQDWHDAGLAVGECIGREGATFVVTGKVIQSIGKIGSGICNVAQDLNGTVKEATLFVHLQGTPQAGTAYPLMKIEQVMHSGLSMQSSISKLPQSLDNVSYVILAAQRGAQAHVSGGRLYNFLAAIHNKVRAFFGRPIISMQPQPGYIDLSGFKVNEKSETNSLSVNWTCHGYKHFPQKNKSWKEVVKSTKTGAAKYKHGVNVESIERHAWQYGINVTNGKPWRVMEFDQVIGSKKGIETVYIRVECSANTIHGHPITAAEFKKLTS